MKTIIAKIAIGLLLISKIDCCPAQPNFSPVFPTVNVPPAYRDAMSKLMLSEVNDYAQQLNLPENLPLTTNCLTQIFVTPPRFAKRFGALGSLHTTNISYGFGKGRHLCFISRVITNSNPYDYEDNKKYAIDPTDVNTNLAYMQATQYLANAFVNIAMLSTSSVVSIKPWTILGMTTCKYTVEWQRDGKPVVKVVVASPQNELWVLRVEDPSLALPRIGGQVLGDCVS